MIPKNVELSGHSCRTDTKQDGDEWIVYITSSDRTTTSNGRGTTEDEAYKAAIAAFNRKVEGK